MINKIEFDPTVDAGYIYLANGKVLESEEIAPGIVLDYDDKNNIIGIEILDLHKQTNSTIEKLPLTIQQYVHTLIANVLEQEVVRNQNYF